MLLLRSYRFDLRLHRGQFVFFLAVGVVRFHEIYLWVVRFPRVGVVVRIGWFVALYACAVVAFRRVFYQVFVGVVVR